MDIDPATIPVQHNEEKRRFEATVDGQTAFAAYMRTSDKIYFSHTEVPEALQSNGLAERIVRYGLDYAREYKLTVVPWCPYVATFIKRHKEYQDLLRPSDR